MSDILDTLNNTQKEAVLYCNGPLLILAGAGTGKTKVLTSRIAHLIQNNLAYPDQILAVTFTNKAANEMLNRVLEYTHNRIYWLGTFHSISAKILRNHANLIDYSSDFNILNYDDQLKIIKNLSKDMGLDEKTYNPKTILDNIQRWKDLGLNSVSVKDSDATSNIARISKKIYTKYQEKLKLLNSLDFGDLILYTIDILSNNPDIQDYYHNKFKYILVDEYQDTNVAQYIWLRLFINESKNICCVGDEDQSIYGWRGAQIGNILRFETDFPSAKLIKLEQNYRSTNNILSSASCVIAKNKQRIGKTLWSKNGDGEKIKIVTLWDDNAEAKYIARAIKLLSSKNVIQSQIAVLVRASFQTRLIEEELIYQAIPYKIIGGMKFYERQEIKDIIAYIRVALNFNDNLAIDRIINVPRRGIGSSTIKSLHEFAEENKINIFSAAQIMIRDGLIRNKTKVSLEELVNNFYQWRKYLLDGAKTLKEAIELILEESGYMKMLESEKSTENTRIENIKELLAAVNDFSTPREFVEHVSLVSDNENFSNENFVSLMTIHAAKGLEFEAVILPGWEENIFPHQRSIAEGLDSLEEERRLAYVAMTRAKKHLIITKAISRRVFGQYSASSPSRFLYDIPSEFAELKDENFINKTTSYEYTNSYNNDYKKPINSSYNQQNQYNTSNSSCGFSLGERVHHKKFGAGYVIAISGNHIEISFDGIGTKRLISDFVEKYK